MAGLFRTASKQPNPLGTAIRTRGSGKYTFGLALSAGLAGLLYGYDTVSISGAIEFLRARYGLSTLMEGLVVSSIMLGAVIGAATAGFLSDRFGRKRILIIGGAFFLVAAVWSALTIGPIALIVARVAGGYGIGLTAALAAVPSPETLRAAEESGFVHEEEALTQALLYRLRTASPAELAALYGMDEGLENRFIAAAQTCSTREALLDCVKTRRYTRARLSRLCAYALLNLTRDFAQTHRAPDYARVLGFRKSAAPLLKTINQRSSIPLITKAANFDRSNPLFALDVLAQDLWSLGVSNPSLRASGRDFTTSPAILSR